MPVPMNDAKRYLLFIADDDSSWDVITAADLREDRPVDGGNDSDQDDYVLVRQEDIVDGIASFMAAYLLALKQTKVCRLPSYKRLSPAYLLCNICLFFSLFVHLRVMKKA